MCDDSTMSTITSKSEKDLCRCCHSEGSYKNLYTPYFWIKDVEEVVYSDMLRECFNIELIQIPEPSQHVLCAICYTCIKKLEDAVRFKRQVLKCEQRFQDISAGCYGKDATDSKLEIIIKEETVDPAESIVFESAVYNNGASRVGSSLPADDDDDDDYEADNNDDYGVDNNMDVDSCSGSLLEKELKKGLKPVKRSKNSKTTTKVKKDKILKEPKQLNEEEILDTIEGGVRVVRCPLVKRDIDYVTTGNGCQCLKCPYTAKSPNGIRLHIRTVHLNIPKYKCQNCTKTFSTIATFTKHKLDDHDIDHRFKCNACEHAFNTKIQLKKHKNTFHMLGVKIKCEECDYETFSVESLYKHKFKHKTVKDFQCKYCRKAFVRKTTMQLHERIHTGDRRKVCAVCGQAFVQKASLNYHMTKYHPEVAF